MLQVNHTRLTFILRSRNQHFENLHMSDHN